MKPDRREKLETTKSKIPLQAKRRRSLPAPAGRFYCTNRYHRLPFNTFSHLTQPSHLSPRFPRAPGGDVAKTSHGSGRAVPALELHLFCGLLLLSAAHSSPGLPACTRGAAQVPLCPGASLASAEPAGESSGAVHIPGGKREYASGGLGTFLQRNLCYRGMQLFSRC